jgi:uncharacterized protein DUF5134
VAGPSWLSDTFAAVMLLIAVYCAARLAVAAAWRRETELDTDVVHLLMGVAMAGTLAPALSFAPSAVWMAVFAVAAAWFAWQAVRVRRGLGAGRWRCPYPVPHLIESLAMVYMFAAVRGTASGGAGMSMSGMGGGAAGMARAPELAVIFALFMVGYVTWLGDRLTLAGPVSSSAPVPSVGSPLPAGAALSSGAALSADAGLSSGTVLSSDTALSTDTVMSAGTVLSEDAASQAGGCWPMLAPRAAACYKIAMGITMCYMLIIML